MPRDNRYAEDIINEGKKERGHTAYFISVAAAGGIFLAANFLSSAGHTAPSDQNTYNCDTGFTFEKPFNITATYNDAEKQIEAIANTLEDGDSLWCESEGKREFTFGGSLIEASPVPVLDKEN